VLNCAHSILLNYQGAPTGAPFLHLNLYLCLWIFHITLRLEK